MSLLSGLFAPKAPAAPAAPANPVPPTQQGADTPTPAPTEQTQQTNTPVQNTEINPLDALGILRQNNDTPDAPPSLQLTSEQLSKAAEQIDFNGLIPQESYAKLQAGLQQGDLSALPEMLAALAKNSWAMGMQHSTTLVDHHLNSRMEYEKKQNANSVRENVLTSQLNSVKDLHPQAREMFVDTAKRLSAKFPEATPQQIEAEVWNIMNSFRQELDVDGKKKQQQQKASEVDWDKFLDS